MQTKIDKQECARLAAEAAVLTRLIMYEFSTAICIDTCASREAQLYKKSRHRLVRRTRAYDAISDNKYIHAGEIIVDRCAGKAPLFDIYDMLTENDNTIRFDIVCPDSCQH